MNDESLFAEALHRKGQARVAFLDEHCKEDVELRVRLEALLRAADNPDPFLDPPGPAPAVTVDEAPVTERRGATIGPYKLLQQIGEGGMGTVWMAQQTEPVKRLVALKLIKAGMDSKQVIARFEAERQALALMDHPNIAKVLDGGTTPPGRPYFVMDLVKGVPITRYCDEHHLTPRQRLELFVPVCQAVQHAHHKGIIHRDLKPSNVLVAPYDGKPVAKVIDFGVAKAAGQQLTDRTLVTGFGAIVGTLEYMSPEQAELNNQDIDTRSDVYALGVLLYELLAGSTPFSCKELEKGGGMLEMLRVIREQEPTRPSTKLSTAEGLPALAANRGTAPATLTRLVRGELDWIVMKALEKDRTRRYETANAFAADVQRYLADEPVLACPPSRWYRTSKFVRRHRGLVMAAALVVGSLLAGVAGTTWQAARATREGNEKQRALEAESAARQRAMAALRTLVDKVVARHLTRQPSLSKEEREFLNEIVTHFQALAALEGDTAESRAIRAEGYLLVGVLRSRLGEPDAAYASYERARELYGQLAEDYPARHQYRWDLATVHTNLARQLGDRGRDLEAKIELDRSLALLEGLATDFPTDPNPRFAMANARQSIGSQLQALGKPVEAEAEFRQIIDIFKRLAADFPGSAEVRSHLASNYTNVAITLKDRGKLAQAEAEHRKALAIYKQLADDFPEVPEHCADLARARDYLANLLEDQGNDAEAATERNQALAQWKQLAAAFPALPDYRWQLGRTYTNRGLRDRAEAEADHRQAVALLKRLATDFPKVPHYRRDLASAHNHLGASLAGLGKPVEAEAEYRQAIALRKQLAADFPAERQYRQDLAKSHQSLGLLFGDVEPPLKGRKTDAEAEAEFRQAITLFKQLACEFPKVPVYSRDLADCHNDLARMLLALRRNEEAETGYRQGIAIYKRLVGDFPTAPQYRHRLAKSHGNLAQVLVSQKRRAEAEAEYRLCIGLFEQLVADFPRVAEYAVGLGGTCCNLANLAAVGGNREDAIRWYRKAIQTLTPIVEQKPQVPNARQFLLRSQTGLARTLENLNPCSETDARQAAIVIYNRGNALLRAEKGDEAIAAYKRALAIAPDYAEAHCNLGLMLRDQDKFADALAALKKGHELGSKQPGWKYPSAGWLAEVERLADLDARLPAVLQGKAKPRNIAEQWGFAEICTRKQMHASAARLYREGLKARPKMNGIWFPAACAAALAGCGKGDEAARLDEMQRSRWRQQALAWLRDDLAMRRQLLKKDTPQLRPLAQKLFESWKGHAALAGLREPAALAKLPQLERQAWEKFWAEVDTLHQQVRKGQP
jgi:serine/threonine protein kinase/tetratricopeptide (TPR) repeat protein